MLLTVCEFSDKQSSEGHTFVIGLNDITSRLYRTAVWHFEIKERLVSVRVRVSRTK
jgi:hypothetical protein